MSWPLIRYALLAAARDRLIMSLLLALAVGTSLAVFMGSSAIAEKSKFVLVFAASGLRLTGVGGLVLFVVFFVRRSFESRDVEFLLSRPLSRIRFLLSYAAAFSLLAAGLASATGATLCALNPAAIGYGHLVWALSLLAEYVVMVNVALFFSMVLTSSAAAAMASFAFYVLTRMMGQILGIIDAEFEHKLRFLEFLMKIISAVMPRLDLMAQTSWLVYGPDAGPGLGFALAQGLVFGFLILIAALVDLSRRQF